MLVRENIPLSRLTTFKVGGTARYVAECASVSDVKDALAFAAEKGVSWAVLGEGSNVLAPDEGYSGLILHMRIPGIEHDSETGALVAGAGVIWDQLVTQAGLRGLWGIENLAGIPGTVGAAPVQNIGAYGSELKDTFLYADVLDAHTGTVERLIKEDCAFGYRESMFKRERNLIILSVALLLAEDGGPKISYKDLQARKDAGAPLTTPREIAAVVRDVRSYKFPDLSVYGTAGSFFKNPVISKEAFALLKERFPEIPNFETEKGIKIPLAWILDHVLNLRSYRMNHASLFERQPLVLVTEDGATRNDVEQLATYVKEEVLRATNISIEREVQSFA